MPESISSAKALELIALILADLSAAFSSFDSDVQQRLGELYATLRADIADARTQKQQIAALRRFIVALDAMPEARAAIGLTGSLAQLLDDSPSGGTQVGGWVSGVDGPGPLSRTLPPDQGTGPPWLGPVGALIGGVIGGVASASDALRDAIDSITAPKADPSLLDRLPPSIYLGAGPPATSAEPAPDALNIGAEPVAASAEPVPEPLLPPQPVPFPMPAPQMPAPSAPAPRMPASAPGAADSLPDLPGDESGHAERALPGDEVMNSPAPAPAASPGAERPPLERYPEIEYPAEVVLGTRTSLFIALLREPSTPSPPQTLSVLRIADTGRADQLPEIEVVVRTRSFDVEPSNTQLLAIERADDAELRFVLIPRQLGPQTIRVDFYQNQRRIGTLRYETTVVERATEAVLDSSSQTELEPLQFAPGAIAPDLELYVEVDPTDSAQLYFWLHSTVEAIDYHHARMGSVRLQGSPLERMQAVYAELSGLAGPAPTTPDEIDYQRRRLERIGNQLWEELFSPELKDAYRVFKDHIRTLLITSDEPWIPWEIVRPFEFDQANARIDEPFLCERFVVARWLSGNGPAEQVPVQRVRPVVPGAVNLASVQAELAYLQRIDQLSSGLVPEPPYNDRNRVIDLFERGDFSVLHFAAHGSFDAAMPGNSSISLTGGPLRPSDLYARFGGPRARPLIFINACHGARAEFAFTGLGGWADRLVRQSRVAAFIGAAWEVNDQLALLFAETFYGALLRDRRSIGESFQIARLRVRDAEPSNSTWLAYVLYADPSAAVTVVSS